MSLRYSLVYLLAAAGSIAVPALGQDAPKSASGATAAPEPAKTVTGATTARVEQIERCQGHKFDSIVMIDPARNRSTRVKLCANPGSTDAAWVRTLEAAIVQIEQRAMPPAAKDKLIGELRQEIGKFAAVSAPRAVTPSAPLFDTRNRAVLLEPTERFETSTLPPFPPPKPPMSARVAAAGGTVAAPPRPAMRFRIKCLVRGESGAGQTCDYFDSSTVLAVSAVAGLEKGGAIRFRRRGEERGMVTLSPLATGQTVRVQIPKEICRGVAFAKVDMELLAPGGSGVVADRVGPYDMRC